MTMQTLAGGVIVPHEMLGTTNTTPAFNTVTMSAAGHKAGFVFEVPKNGDIHSVGFRTATVTTGDTLKIGLYTVDPATGFPTTTPYKTMTAGTQVVANADDNVWFTVNLGSDAVSAVAGDIISAVIEFNSFVAGNLQIADRISQLGTSTFAYSLAFAAAWSMNTVSIPVLYIRYSDGSASPILNLLPITTVTAQSFSNATNPNEYALQFTLPFPSRAVGFFMLGGSSVDFNVILYSGTTPLATVTFDKDILGTGATRGRLMWRFATPVSLAAGTTYYLALTPSAASASTLLFTVPEAAAMGQMPGGTSFILATRNGGAWTPVDTQRPLYGIILDQFDDGTAVGGGLLTHPGMAGGMRA